MSTRFIGDLHLRHRLMVETRGFATLDEHDETLIDNWNKVVEDDDTTYLVGDAVFQPATSHNLLDKLRGYKYLVAGNHDMNQEVLKHFDKVYGCIEYKGYIVSHMPVHPNQLNRYKGCIHGHMHKAVVKKTITQYWVSGISHGEDELEVTDLRYANVSAEQVNYTPITWEALKERQGW